MSDLATKTCKPCEGDTEPLSDEVADALLQQIPEWRRDGGEIHREWTREDFADAVAFVNRIAALAEAEGHHPDLLIHGYKHVTVALSTHSIGGLSDNDFILAAKIDGLA